MIDGYILYCTFLVPIPTQRKSPTHLHGSFRSPTLHLNAPHVGPSDLLHHQHQDRLTRLHPFTIPCPPIQPPIHPSLPTTSQKKSPKSTPTYLTVGNPKLPRKNRSSITVNRNHAYNFGSQTQNPYPPLFPQTHTNCPSRSVRFRIPHSSDPLYPSTSRVSENFPR
ncbi:hypothetical protein M011DRAFT_472120 [Sporormia fimetaria CBS 119925]|uniref:Uncharacterized protein n=1 Tax=Sporormia fimetaria CBS 119925 TaxID=1340428 RepID=A0A6A6UXN3_9PLEO|nr:hypothetical protein M011DRAFT_472120 [Sporormia fimetaria CBS 119925]